MKKLAMLVALVLAFSMVGLAQDTGTAKAGKKGTKATAGETGTKAKAAKTSQLTGCLEKSPSGSGYVLKNGRYKEGVDVKSSEDWSAHAGHKVMLKGTWDTPGKSFTATSLKHEADTCTVGGKGGATKTKGTKAKATKEPSK